MRLVKTKKEKQNEEGAVKRQWRILIVDDEEGIHTMTELNLRGFLYQGRELELLHAYTGQQAREMLAQEQDIALALIDVVMESDHAGLALVDYIRNELHNRMIRLIIRTGQAGAAPEREVIDNYDIDGYHDKSELTVQKVYSTVRTALKGYHDLKVIDTNRQGLNRILQATPDLYLPKVENIETFFTGVLTQMAALCDLDGIIMARANTGGQQGIDGFVAMEGQSGGISACIGSFCQDDAYQRAQQIHNHWGAALLAGRVCEPVPDNGIMAPLMLGEEVTGYIYMEGVAHLGEDERQLVNTMATQVSSALQAINLQGDLHEANQLALKMLAQASECMNEHISEHLQRVCTSTEQLALFYGLDPSSAYKYGEAAILQKPTSLEPAEFKQMQAHALAGEQLLHSNRFLMLARDCAISHHERWDGSGYPYGRKGEEIPLIGRLVAVMDVFDALTHERPYKQAWPLQQAVAEIEAGAGTQFDPRIVAAFMALYHSGGLETLI